MLYMLHAAKIFYSCNTNKELQAKQLLKLTMG